MKPKHEVVTDKKLPLLKKQCLTQSMPLVGRHIEMEFNNEDGSTTWWGGKVTNYKTESDTYEAYFPYDCTTVEFSSLDDDYRLVAS